MMSGVLDGSPARSPERGPLQRTPGFLGYVCGILVALLTLATELALVTALEPPDGLSAAPLVFVATLLFGLVPAAVMGAVGMTVTHLATRRCATRWPAVLVAAASGFVLCLCWTRADDVWLPGLVAVAAGVGRLAAPRRRRALVDQLGDEPPAIS